MNSHSYGNEQLRFSKKVDRSNEIANFYGWFDEQIQRQGADAVIQVSTVGQNTPVGNRTPCSYLYPETTPGSETVVYGAPPECDEQS